MRRVVGAGPGRSPLGGIAAGAHVSAAPRSPWQGPTDSADSAVGPSGEDRRRSLLIMTNQVATTTGRAAPLAQRYPSAGGTLGRALASATRSCTPSRRAAG